MKKSVAAVLLLAIFFAAMASLLPVSALETGDNISEEDLFPAEEGWIAIEKASDWANIKAGGKYYLADDIVFGDRQYMPSEENSVDLVIDGNNRTVTLSQTQRALFSRTTRLTLKNIFIDGTLVYSDHAGMHSPIVRYDNLEKTVLTNVISRVNYTVTNYASTYTSVSGVIPKAPKDSVFQKVMYTGNITLELGTRFYGVAGIVYTADGATLIDCVNNGNLTVKGAVMISGPKRNYFALGGVCARTESSTSFVRCVNNGAISTNARVSQYETNMSGNIAMGGIVGYSSGDTFTDCKNTGDISQRRVETTAPPGYIGGIVGYSENGLTLKGCTAVGNILCEEKSFFVGGIIGRTSGSKINNCTSSANITLSNSSCFAGGIQGYSYNASADIVECASSCSITLLDTASDASVGGILGGAKIDNGTFGSVWVEKSSNSGSIITGVDTRNVCAGGIVGSIQGVPAIYIQNCLNSGDITNTFERGSSATGGIIASLGNIESGSLGSQTAVVDINSCINTGELYGNDRVGGIVGGIIKFMLDDVVISISRCSNRGELSGILGVGGILGVFNESSYNSAANIYSLTGISIELCENTAFVSAEKIAGGIIGYVCEIGAEPKIEILSCVNAATVGEKGENVATQASGGFVGQTPVNVRVNNSLSFSPIRGEQAHIIGNGEILAADCFYTDIVEVDSIVGASPLAPEELSAKRAGLEVLAYDREMLQTVLDGIEKLNKDDYKLSSWLDLLDEVEASQQLLSKDDTELYQSELTEKIRLLNELTASLRPVATQTQKTEKVTDGADDDDGCGSILGGASILILSLAALGATALGKKKE